MAKKTATDALLIDCEPYFLDGVQTIAEFVRRTQEIIQRAMDRQWDSLIGALDLKSDEIVRRLYCDPEKLQNTKPGEDIAVGDCLKIRNVLEVGFHRYWETDETGIAGYIWLKEQTKLVNLGTAIENLSDPWPEPASAWGSDLSNVYSFWRVLSNADTSQIDSRLDELITCFIDCMTKVGGLRKLE